MEPITMTVIATTLDKINQYLPPEVKYLIFLGIISADAGASAFFGITSGIIGGTITFLISTIFNLSWFSVSSLQLLFLFALAPLFWFALTASTN